MLPGPAGLQGLAGLELESDSVYVTMVVGENMRDWIEGLVEVVTEVALSQGKERITTRGRKGWDRVLAPYGFEREGDELNKVVKHGIQ